MKLWKPAVCLLLSGLLLSACAAPAGSASSGAGEEKGESSGARPETEAMESGLDLEALGVTEENYPRVDGSTSTLGIVQAAYEAVFGPESMDEEGYPWDWASSRPPMRRCSARSPWMRRATPGRPPRRCPPMRSSSPGSWT